MNLNSTWKKYSSYIVSAALALSVGILAGLISGGSMEIYTELIKPPLAPPGWVFPAVWFILYILMGIAAADIWESSSPDKDTALTVYAVQLAVNFLWPIFYFVFDARLLSFIWIIFLIILVFLTIKQFSAISPKSGWLLLPYFAWLLFAAYLNLATLILN